MDSELDLLLGTAIDSLVKLELLLYMHARPGILQSADDIAVRLRRPVPEVGCALDDLAAGGLVDRFAIGTGRYVMYGPTEDDHVQRIIGLLHARYHRDPQTRADLVRGALDHSRTDQPVDSA